jgi:hypothetical protein
MFAGLLVGFVVGLTGMGGGAASSQSSALPASARS